MNDEILHKIITIKMNVIQAAVILTVCECHQEMIMNPDRVYKAENGNKVLETLNSIIPGLKEIIRKAGSDAKTM